MSLPRVGNKTLVVAASLCLSLSAQSVWAQFIIHVTPSANPQTSLADLKKNPDTPVTLTQALAILKDPALRDAKGILKESITIQLDAGTYRLGETIDIDAASSGDAEHPVTIEGPKDASAIISGGRAVSGFTPLLIAPFWRAFRKQHAHTFCKPTLPSKALQTMANRRDTDLGATQVTQQRSR